MNHFTDAQLLQLRQDAFKEAKYLSDNMETRALRAERLLALAESFIPLSKKYTYELLKAPPRNYGGSD